SMKLGEMEGVSDELLVVLEAVGIMSIAELARTPLETLAQVPGLDEAGADSLLATAQATHSELSKMIDKTIAEELEKEAAEERPLFDEEALAEAEEATEAAAEGTEDAEAAAEESAAASELFENFPEGDAEADGEAD
ncbi:MAG: helix-hairpin-helix domain-containing protein, partial [bacterium]|nr:helix-hairpin-helix domain-containing protein [bacterium]